MPARPEGEVRALLEAVQADAAGGQPGGARSSTGVESVRVDHRRRRVGTAIRVGGLAVLTVVALVVLVQDRPGVKQTGGAPPSGRTDSSEPDPTRPDYAPA